MVRDRQDVVGALLVGGASRRFGSPKALAVYEGETLAARGHRVLLEAFGRVLVVGKQADGLELPFPLVDDASDVRAPIVGVAAALREAAAEVCVVLPTDMPHVTSSLLRSLAAGAEGVDAAVPQSGPLPGAYRRTALPVLGHCIATGDLALYGALAELRTRVVQCDDVLLANVNTPSQITEEGRRKRP